MLRLANLRHSSTSIRFNEAQLVALIEKALGDNCLRGFLCKRTNSNARWQPKWCLLFENLLFYFDAPIDESSQVSVAQHCNNNQHHHQHQHQGNGDEFCLSSASPTRALSNLIRVSSRLARVKRQQVDCNVDNSKVIQSSPKLKHQQQLNSSSNNNNNNNNDNINNFNEDNNNNIYNDDNANEANDDNYKAALNRQRELASINANYEKQRRRGKANASSASISGVSHHSFQLRNELTVGRTTTTAAGKLNSPLASYASLLKSKIGVIFLEGSYCESVAESDKSATAATATVTTTTITHSTKPLRLPMKNALRGDALDLNCSLQADAEAERTFALRWKKHGSKEYQFMCETALERETWTRAITSARYSTLVNEKEQLEQKYLHLSQIAESEATAKWQFSRQCDELATEVAKLRQELCSSKRRENRSSQLQLVLSKSASLVDAISRQHQLLLARSSSPLAATPTAKDEGEAGAAAETTAILRFDETQKNARKQKHNKQRKERRRQQQQQQQKETTTTTNSSCDDNNSSSSNCSSSSEANIDDADDNNSTTTTTTTTNNIITTTTTTTNDDSVNSINSSDDNCKRKQTKRKQTKCINERLLEQLQSQVASKSLARQLNDKLVSLELESVVEVLGKRLRLTAGCVLDEAASEELAKIKKVQGFFRGWLCRRRWKQIVQEYIKSPHAESMRKRNNLVFRMVEAEEEYVEQLSLLITAFLRPIKMVASSQKPALSHDELNSIFLNAETLLFLHQIFLKGLMARMESWPTLVLADLFNMLLPMLTIYQEFVRNHHFSLKVLAECKQREQFNALLARLEEKPQLDGRTLETFLTYPMHQIPRYIICLHEILAHTPHNHVERKSLFDAQTQLEDLSRQMHDEASETENIRKNLEIERMIVGGCDLLLDVEQVFVRQGVLYEQTTFPLSLSLLADCATNNKQQYMQQQQQQLQRTTRALSSQNSDSDTTAQGTDCKLARMCFLFTNHLILCTRTKDGKLKIVEPNGKISLAEATLVESVPAMAQQLRAQQQQQQQQQHQRRATSNSLAADCFSFADGAKVNKQQTNADANNSHSSSNKRTTNASKSIASYLSSKLSTLAAGIGSQSQAKQFASWQHQSLLASASAPASPRRPSRRPTTTTAAATATAATTDAEIASRDFALIVGWPKAAAAFAASTTASMPFASFASVDGAAICLADIAASPLAASCCLSSASTAACRLASSSSSTSSSASASMSASASTSQVFVLHLVAPSAQEKAAWLSDISQCIDNVHFNDFCNNKTTGESLVSAESIGSDPRLFKDDKDIMFSRTLNSCKLPQIRYATKDRLFERLTDLRFLSVDFLNTFLLTYRVHSTGIEILEALRRVYCDSAKEEDLVQQQQQQQQQIHFADDNSKQQQQATRQQLIDSASSSRCLRATSSKPQVPPRSPCAKDFPSANFDCLSPSTMSVSSSQQVSSLQLPSNANKRRSTIITLTPITGSSISLASNINDDENDDNNNQNQLSPPSYPPPTTSSASSSFAPHNQLASVVKSALASPAYRATSASCSIRLSADDSEYDIDSDDNDSSKLQRRATSNATRNNRLSVTTTASFFDSADSSQQQQQQHRARSFSFSPTPSARDARAPNSPCASPTALQSVEQQQQSSLLMSAAQVASAVSSSGYCAAAVAMPAEPHWRLIRRRERCSDSEQLSASNLELAAKSKLCVESATSTQSSGSMSMGRSLQNLSSVSSSTTKTSNNVEQQQQQQTKASSSATKSSDKERKKRQSKLEQRLTRFALREIELADSHTAADDTSGDDERMLSSDAADECDDDDDDVVHCNYNTDNNNNNNVSNVINTSKHDFTFAQPINKQIINDKQSSGSKRSSVGISSDNSFVDCSKSNAASSQRLSSACELTSLRAASSFSPRYSVQCDSLLTGGDQSAYLTRAGVVVTGKAPHVQSRRSSTASGASAFAAATAASSNPMPPTATAFIDAATTRFCDTKSASPTKMQRNDNAQQPHSTSASPVRCKQQQQQQQQQYEFSCSPNDSRASSRVSSSAGIDSASLTSSTIIGASCSQASRLSQPHIVGGSQFSRSRFNSQPKNSLRTTAVARVLSVLRHWISKHRQDFVNDQHLASQTYNFLHELATDKTLLAVQNKAACQLAQDIFRSTRDELDAANVRLLLTTPAKHSPDSIETLSALEIAETMTYLDHKIFLSIRSEEFLGQAWMKADKALRAPHILLITKRFNDVSRLVASEIVRVADLNRRVAIFEKWTNVAHICRVLHNFNGVLQICAAFTNSAVFRLKKTWDKMPKTTRAAIEQLQNLVSTDSRFKNMRDAINRSDPPSIPYVGMYLTDLSFIEEGTPNYPDKNSKMLNFSKMRMVAHVIREIQQLQNGSYKIELNSRVANYLLDNSRHLQEEELYKCSLEIEPRVSSNASKSTQSTSNNHQQHNHYQRQHKTQIHNFNNHSTLNYNRQQQQQQQQPKLSMCETSTSNAHLKTTTTSSNNSPPNVAHRMSVT